LLKAPSQSIFRETEPKQIIYQRSASALVSEPKDDEHDESEVQQPMYVHLSKPEKRKLGKKLLLPEEKMERWQ
jgi:hypothetical protein